MRRPILFAAVGLAAATLTGTALPSSAAPSAAGQAHGHKRVCDATPTAGTASCHAEVRTKGANATPDATTSYSSGYSPAQLQKAYAVPGAQGHPTIAIVDAYANPNAASDLAKYRSQFQLPAVNVLGGPTFTQYRQNGTTISSRNRPAASVGWGQEESLDLDMASAICPACNVMYVGANSAGFLDLKTAVQTAYNKGARVISNSYGGSEFSGEASYAGTYGNLQGAINTISSGDSGYGPQFPAAAGGPGAVAVGGTSLTLNPDGTRNQESVWNGAGSGCSAYIPKPTWQSDGGCANRTIADVSAVADPATGVAVYDSYGSSSGANWFVFGGTSVAAPIVGAYYAAQGVPATGVQATYNAASSLYDVTSGSNGTCAPAYLCTGIQGYDGPSGLGTPRGTLG